MSLFQKLPREMAEEVVFLLPPADVLRLRFVDRAAYMSLSNDHVEFWNAYTRLHNVKILKKVSYTESVARHVQTKCSECGVRGSRTVYPFETRKGIRLCRDCLYAGTINSHYLRDVDVSFQGLGATRALITSYGRQLLTQWHWKRDVDRRIQQVTGLRNLDAYRERKREEEDRKREEALARAEELDMQREGLKQKVFARAVCKASEDEINALTEFLESYHFTTRGLDKDETWINRKAQQALRKFRCQGVPGLNSEA